MSDSAPVDPFASQSPAPFEDNQQGDYRNAAKTPPVIVPPQPPAGAPSAIVVDAGHPAPPAPIVPQGTLIIPPASTPRAGTPVTPLSSSQPAPFQGGNVTTASGTPPTRGTLIVQPTTPGPVAMPTASPASSSPASAPSAGSGSAAQPVPTPPARPASNLPATTPTTAVGNSMSPQATLLADVLRAAAQIVADRDAADAAAEKARDKFVIDESKIKALRDQLYDDMEGLFKAATQVSSPAISAYALDTLKKARMLIVAGASPDDLAQAELLIERVRTKLNRSDTLLPPGELWHIVGILAWNLIVFLCSLPLAVTFLYTGDKLQIVNLTFGRESIPFLASFGWGAIGGVIGVLYNMTWFVQQRDYDPAYNLDYIVRPIKGFIVGGILMLAFAFVGGNLGLASLSSGQSNPLSFGAVYLISALGGFKQEVIFDWFDAVLKAALRTASAKAESDANVQSATPK